MSENLDITGIDHAELLAELYNNAGSPGSAAFARREERMTAEEAREILAGPAGIGGRGSFDYLRGRALKVRFEDNTLYHAWLYDRDNGEGAAQRAIDAVRARTGVRS